MAEYYPLLAKAIGSLPNSTPDMRRIVYERARKALIGQLRTLHPPVPDDDIERESIELDRAVERLEGELASKTLAIADAGPGAAEAHPVPPGDSAPVPAATGTFGGAPSPAARAPIERPPVGRTIPDRVPLPPLRTKAPRQVPVTADPSSAVPMLEVAAAPTAEAARPTATTLPPDVLVRETGELDSGGDGPRGFKLPGGGVRTRADGQRPIAPQPLGSEGPKRRLWIIPAGIGIVVALVGLAAYKLRDHPQTTARTVSTEPQAENESGKIAERVDGNADTSGPSPVAKPAAKPTPVPVEQATAPAAPANPDLLVLHRAALLVDAPDEASKVKTYLGSTVWKLNNVSGGPNDAVGLAVEADVDLPDDKMKVVVIFEKNTDASLPATHTIKVRFLVQPGSPTGDVKQISVPQLRREDSPSGDALAGVTVPIVANSFLVGLSPGTTESANLDLLRVAPWIDVPMLLANGKIAKLTFEKSDSGQRDLNEAITAWSK